ncbi:glycosyltransferase family 4 protein [Micromonospora rhizosphaerae]|nr:glycosyltransferase family 4 protein [Micromonospora rhizosphaerae]
MNRPVPRVALVTSHPLSAPWDSADKHLAEVVARMLPEYRFLSVRRVGANRDVPGRQVPVLSRTGRPGPLVSAQVAAFALGALPLVDLVHAVVTIGSGFPLLARCLGSAAARLGRPVLHTAPGVVDPSGLSAGPGPVPHLGTTVVLSQQSARALRAAGFPDVRVVPPSLPLHRWRVAPRPTGEPVVLFAGHYDNGGGAEIAVAAFAASAMRDRGRLVLAMRSRPGQDEAKLAERLRRHAESLGVDRIDVRGHVADMPALVRSATVVVLPAATLAGKADIPLVLLEAMAAGRPVVASDLPSLAVLDPAVARVRPEAGATARAIDEILTDDGVWRHRALAGRQLVERKFSEAAVARRYREVYRELLDRGPGGAPRAGAGSPPVGRSAPGREPMVVFERGERR